MAKQKGGKREGAGRKSKAIEDRIRKLSISALKSIYGSEEKAFEHIAKLARESFPHLKLLFEYAYGKPREYKEHTGDVTIKVEMSEDAKSLFGRTPQSSKGDTNES